MGGIVRTDTLFLDRFLPRVLHNRAGYVTTLDLVARRGHSLRVPGIPITSN